MAVNKDQRERWPEDFDASIKHYKEWSSQPAPTVFASTRQKTAETIGQTLKQSDHVRVLDSKGLACRVA